MQKHKHHRTESSFLTSCPFDFLWINTVKRSLTLFICRISTAVWRLTHITSSLHCFHGRCSNGVSKRGFCGWWCLWREDLGDSDSSGVAREVVVCNFYTKLMGLSDYANQSFRDRHFMVRAFVFIGLAFKNNRVSFNNLRL